MTNPNRSDSAARGWDDPQVRERRKDRVACEACQLTGLGAGPWQQFDSVPKAFRHLGIATHPDPLKCATAKAVRLVIAQGGQVRIKGYQFRRKES